MKSKRKKAKKLINMSDAELLDFVAAKVKNRELFPERLEAAKKFLQKVKFVADQGSLTGTPHGKSF